MTVDEVNEIEPRSFFRDYVFTRRPCKIKARSDNDQLDKWKHLQYLSAKCGDAVLSVRLHARVYVWMCVCVPLSPRLLTPMSCAFALTLCGVCHDATG